MALDAAAPTVIDIPVDSRGGREAPEAIPIQGPWKLVGNHKGRRTFEAALPVRPRALFFFRPLPGMKLVGPDGAVIPHDTRRGKDGTTWKFNARTVTVTVAEDAPAPASGDYKLTYPKAVEREHRLNQGMSGLEPASFVKTVVQAGPEARAGLLVPAPGALAYDLTVPDAAELHLDLGLVAPEVLDSDPSNGATAVVAVEAGGETVEVLRRDLEVGVFDHVRVDLARWADTPVRLHLRSEDGGDPAFDYVFFGDPVVSPRRADPQRVVILFVDTLRPDHLGTYGYERPTSPHLDTFAQGATVFENARSVAPWTLPSARTMVTGRQPEAYYAGPTLQGLLHERGWATAMFAGNVYLSSNFDMHRDWGLHWVVNKPPAPDQVNRALQWLEDNDGRDALLMLHFMDVHLDYREPVDYRFLFAGKSPDGLGERFHRSDVVRAKLDEEGKKYVVDRYDNTIRYVDDQLPRLLDALDDNDIVVFLSDHGEEFWEHGGYEHGHTLYDELLRVPLIMRGPGLTAGRVAAPTSLLDVAPTIAEIVGVDLDGAAGQSLRAASQGDNGALAALDTRSQAFGRPLYGHEKWGVLHETMKWTSGENRQRLFDLAADPREKKNQLRRPDDAIDATYLGHLSDALGRPAVRAIRFLGLRSSGDRALEVEVTVPGGIAVAWVGADPTNKSAAEVEVQGDRATMTWPRGMRGSREVFVLPARPLAEVLPEIHGTARAGQDESELQLQSVTGPLSKRRVLAKANVGGRALNVTFGVAPLPAEGLANVDGYDPEVEAMLQALGYLGDE